MFKHILGVSVSPPYRIFRKQSKLPVVKRVEDKREISGELAQIY